MSPVPQHYHHHRQYEKQGQHRYGHYDRRFHHHSRQELRPKEVFQHFAKYRQQFNISSLKCFRKYFQQNSILAQSTFNSIQEFDGSNREATIPWLDQVKLVAERTGIDPLEDSY